MNEKKSSVRTWWLAIPGGMMMLALMLGIIVNPRMLDAVNLRNILFQCGPAMLIGAAIAIPFSRGYVDLSVLGNACFTGMVSAMLAEATYMPAGAMILVAICISAAIGAINGLITMIFRRKNVLLSGAVTACIGVMYRQLALAITGGTPIRLLNAGRVRPNVALMFLLPALVMVGVFALISFTGGGKRAFNGIYEKDEDRNSNPILPFVFSGMLAGFAAVLMVMRLYSAQPTIFSLNASHLLLPALAGFAIPNAKNSKIGAFLGYIAVIVAALAVSIIQNVLVLAGMNSFAQNIFCAVLGVVFVILNAIFGSKAAKPLAAPAFIPAEPVPEDEKPETDSILNTLSELAKLYESSEITEEEYNLRKQEIISRF